MPRELTVEEKLERLDADEGHERLPVEVDPETFRPPRGYVLVECCADTGVDERGFFVCYERSAATFLGWVVAVGHGVTEVKVGDKVVVESMSGHPAMGNPLVDLDGHLLAVVPCRKPDPVQVQDEYHAKRWARFEALKQVFHGRPNHKIPPRALEEIRLLKIELLWLRRQRRGKSRSRLFKPLMDLARGQGVLAVIEEET